MFRLSWFVVGMFLGCCLAIAAATQARDSQSHVTASPISVILSVVRGN
ncbi:MAG TPA: hypothetical protein PLM14_00865 [Candidatus Hydrogenedentes bacterium]|nr:hypothetical protein [Candidatus Hydrogenedentota bacterium]HQE81515.1 hypothetical protein [Candidatus Hydrogenedentota bacterium]HQH51350.1 hypothetical protein [Candidatus Hydrogenedentota bacterium]HQM49510.1 hypothetical protein [Candidatus Hydrogenedentota bacterium]